ncbi:MAG TPA: MASE1 domain-containing protein [Vicinamibacterales bacterium]|nr:MASE1 domain-containing protein [Vicinamibacterales bacterium]
MRGRDVAWNAGLAGLYWLLAELTLLPATPEGRVMPLWPPAGVALSALLLGGPRLLPGVALGALLTTTLHMSFVSAALVAAGMLFQVIVDVRLLQRFEFDHRLERVRDPLVLAGVTLAGAAVAALFGVTSLLFDPSSDGRTWPYALVIWWMRDWLGALIVGSLVLTWMRSRPIHWTRPRIAEAIAMVMGMLLLIQLLFGFWALFPGHNVPMAFTFFPVVGYAGLRFGPAGASTLMAVVAASAIPMVAQVGGPFGTLPVGMTIFVLHAFLLLGWLSGQTLAAVRAEWEAALERRIALEEQLRHSQKMEAVGRLAGGIAHDFNNLLTAIIGYAELVMVRLDPEDPRRADAEEIARAAMRAADLTRHMLAFSRKQNLQPKVLDLNVTLAKAEPMLRRVIGEDIVLTIAPKATRPLVRVDPGQIEQVIMNLVVNARDAMPHGGRLTVDTADVPPDVTALPPDAPAASYVLLAVSDTGIGMSAEVRARIFEPYFTTKDVGKGTGLGLSTAYGIVRQSDGYLQVNSEPGLGTSFRIYLPRTEEAAPAEAVGDDTMPGGAEHILLVEDEPSVRRLSREILVRLGYSVTEAASGRAGLALGSDDTRHFDLALCDVILGDMSGPAVYEALRALRPTVRVLYMSGYADEAIVRTGVLDEGQPFLQKPFTPRELAVKIRDVLDRRGDD